MPMSFARIAAETRILEERLLAIATELGLRGTAGRTDRELAAEIATAVRELQRLRRLREHKGSW